MRLKLQECTSFTLVQTERGKTVNTVRKHTTTFNNSVNTEYDDGMHYCYLKVKSVIFFDITIFLLPQSVILFRDNQELSKLTL